MSGPSTLPAPNLEAQHDCTETLGGTTWAAKTLGVGGCSRCSRCGRWWVLRRRHASIGGFRWYPVRWYHARLRHRIAATV